MRGAGSEPELSGPFHYDPATVESSAPRPGRGWIRGVCITMALAFALIALCQTVTG